VSLSYNSRYRLGLTLATESMNFTGTMDPSFTGYWGHWEDLQTQILAANSADRTHIITRIEEDGCANLMASNPLGYQVFSTAVSTKYLWLTCLFSGTGAFALSEHTVAKIKDHWFLGHPESLI